MKKSLILTLALVFVLSIAGTALAANPFTDVPANHWAYASISKLAQSGIIDGYGDGRFVGNNTMTRYEMAQIVAKAMAKVDSADAAQRAQIEKFAAEFADELDSLGVRVAKLEKNADNVKITGEARFSYRDYDKGIGGNSGARLRSRIWLSGEVNDNWKYGGMFENHQNLQTNDREGDVRLRRAWVEGNIGVINVTAGRFAYVPVFGVVLDNDADGAKIGYEDNRFKINAFALRPQMDNGWYITDSDDAVYGNYAQNVQVYGAEIGWEFAENFRFVGAYYRVDGKKHGGADGNIFEAGLEYDLTNDFGIWGEYIRGIRPDSGYMGIANASDVGKNGWAAGVRFSKAVRNDPGTFEVRGAYYDVPAVATFSTTPELDITGLRDGYKGWTVGASFVVAKNIGINIDYFDFKTQGDIESKQKEKLLWSYVRFYF